MFIYKITNIINNKVYVGQTRQMNVNTRWRTHKLCLKKNTHKNKHLQSSYNKHGIINFVFEIIEELTENINEREQYWIEFYNSSNIKNGYNKTKGGDGCLGFKMPREIVERLSILSKGRAGHFKGKHHTEESKRKLSEARAGKYNGVDNHFFGKKHSEETREKMSKSSQNKIPCNKKSIICINNNTVYESSYDAARKLNLKPSSIRSVLQGKSKALRGLVFKYVNENTNG